jgi:hypothetical protein
MTALIIFSFVCLCLLISLSVKYNKLLKASEKLQKDANDFMKSHWKITQRFSRFVTKHDLVDKYVGFEENRDANN